MTPAIKFWLVILVIPALYLLFTKIAIDQILMFTAIAIVAIIVIINIAFLMALLPEAFKDSSEKVLNQFSEIKYGFKYILIVYYILKINVLINKLFG